MKSRVEFAKLEEKLRLQKKRPDYDPTEQEEASGILSKYDEEIDGKRAKHFTLDGVGSSARAQKNLAEAAERTKSKGIRVNLDAILTDVGTSDYQEPTVAKIRKSKPKKEKRTRQKADDGDFLLPESQIKIEEDAMDVDEGKSAQKKTQDLQFDDEDLQLQLAQSRRQALKKRKKEMVDL